MFDFETNARLWYPNYLSADDLKLWVQVGNLSAVSFKEITGQDYTG